MDCRWAKLCGVHIVAEVPEAELRRVSHLVRFEQVLDAFRQAGAEYAIVYTYELRVTGYGGFPLAADGYIRLFDFASDGPARTSTHAVCGMGTSPMPQRSFIVIGGTGLIGSAVVAHLRATGALSSHSIPRTMRRQWDNPPTFWSTATAIRSGTRQSRTLPGISRPASLPSIALCSTSASSFTFIFLRLTFIRYWTTRAQSRGLHDRSAPDRRLRVS